MFSSPPTLLVRSRKEKEGLICQPSLNKTDFPPESQLGGLTLYPSFLHENQKPKSERNSFPLSLDVRSSKQNRPKKLNCRYWGCFCFSLEPGSDVGAGRIKLVSFTAFPNPEGFWASFVAILMPLSFSMTVSSRCWSFCSRLGWKSPF